MKERVSIRESHRCCSLLQPDNSKFFWPSANPSHPVELQMGLYNFIAWGQLRCARRVMLAALAVVICICKRAVSCYVLLYLLLRLLSCLAITCYHLLSLAVSCCLLLSLAISYRVLRPAVSYGLLWRLTCALVQL
jgi:hypothetical protein